MLIWLINAYGPIPGEGWRDYRYTMIGQTLAEAGHQVVWWTSNYSHHFKQFRSQAWEERAVGPRFHIRLVPTSAYKKNISLARVQSELRFAWGVYRRAEHEPCPECIIAADPPQTVGRMAYRLAKRSKCPLIFDVMDLWPELFALALPNRWRRPASNIFYPLLALRQANHSHADGLIALCESYRAQMIEQQPACRAVPSAAIFNGIDVAQFRSRMRDSQHEVDLPPTQNGTVRAVYAGSLGENYDVHTLLQACQILEKRAVPIQVLVAGVGPMLGRLTDFIKKNSLRNVVYLGQLAPEQLPSLYRRSEIGISAYGSASTVSMPDKVYDYMAAGLPVINSLRGELAELLTSRNCGLSYSAGDPLSLSAALERLCFNKELREEMAQRSWTLGTQFDRYLQYGVLPRIVEEVCRNYRSKMTSDLSAVEVAG